MKNHVLVTFKGEEVLLEHFQRCAWQRSFENTISRTSLPPRPPPRPLLLTESSIFRGRRRSLKLDGERRDRKSNEPDENSSIEDRWSRLRRKWSRASPIPAKDREAASCFGIEDKVVQRGSTISFQLNRKYGRSCITDVSCNATAVSSRRCAKTDRDHYDTASVVYK